jgi:hypothetical protein
LRIATTVIVFITLLSLSLLSCQKESSFERELTSRFSLNGGNASCTGAIISGTYVQGTATNGSNKVILNVYVDSVGSYEITTDSINGLSFSGKGFFNSAGEQTITLFANGTPTVSGIYNFTPIPNGCTFAVTVTANSGGAAGASYSFDGGVSSCTGATVNGTFTAGTAMSAGNTVTLKLTVNTIGSYSISTNTVNGITFAGSGSFTATGAQSVTLKASGTPSAAGNFSFIPGGNACSFNVTVTSAGGGSTGGGSTGGSGNFLKCKINGVLSNFNTSLVGLYTVPPFPGTAYSITAKGKNSDVTGSPIELWVSASNPTAPDAGAYVNILIAEDPLTRGCHVAWHPNGFGASTFWGSSIISANTFTVNVTSVTTSGATGTFYGTLHEENGIGPAVKQITEGAFKVSF